MQTPQKYHEQESEVSEDDSESLHHVQLMQNSIEVLETKSVGKPKHHQSSTYSPLTIRKLDSRSNDDLTKHPPSESISNKK